MLHRDMLDFTKKLVRIRTENPPGADYLECVEFIAETLKGFGLRSRIVRVKSSATPYPRYCLLASHGEGRNVLFFHGHYDVVPAPGTRSFYPRFKSGRLYGRGTSDMKGGLTAMIYAIHIVQCLDARLDGRVRLVIVPDEETGSALGTRYLFDHGYITPNGALGMLMPEPTSGAVWNACRGAYSLMVTVKGRPAHVALQHQGVNAFEQMYELMKALMKLKHAVEMRKTDYRVAVGESNNSIQMLGGVCRCGTNFNVVPGECTFSIERRINPEENLGKEKKRLLKLLDRFRKQGINISTEILQEGESYGISSDHELACVLARNIRQLHGYSPEFLMCPGLLETRYYIKKGIPAYAYGPGLLSCAHGHDEFIPVERIYDCAMVYALTAVNILSEQYANA
jgi:succinyl-diaminopimelate desuccinylase